MSDEIAALGGENTAYISELYDLYKKDPALVDPAWAQFFEKALANNGTTQTDALKAKQSGEVLDSSVLNLQGRVHALIAAYRNWGHLKAKINPLQQGVHSLPQCDDLDASFSASELSAVVDCAGLAGLERMNVGQVIDHLTRAYCSSIGFEFGHILSAQARRWLQERVETQHPRALSADEHKRAFRYLVRAEELETHLHRKYVGQKRFSLQGGETLIPLLDHVLNRCATHGVREVVMGQAHRGRINVLCNIVGRPIEILFSEFEDTTPAVVVGAGDVKYHNGYAARYRTSSGAEIGVMLATNPSHLEYVNAVVEGVVRAKQDLVYQQSRSKVLPLLMHGDAAFVGEGVVTEVLNLSKVKGYSTGGTLHVVINNQIGFTTDVDDARSTVYCTDFAKAVQAPIFHVNGEDVEACLWVAALALDYRQTFASDVVIDMYCYRKYGHNEGDDPTFTQPRSYAEIQGKKGIARLYGERLIASNILEAGAVEKEVSAYAQEFKTAQEHKRIAVLGDACPVFGKLRVPSPKTAVTREVLEQIAQCLTSYPQGFKPHAKIHALLEKRVQSVREGKGIDWGCAEALAYGALMLEGYPIRISGQDVERGTFSHRHLVLQNTESAGEHMILDGLRTLGSRVAQLDIFNSTLSEAGVLGFEFGYGSVASQALVLWEAQFGDFANCAQVIIDQFIASSETKWHQFSGVALLLPHGFEGQGPEHSSARLERFLQLCAEGNMVVCYPSNAAQQFHLLRRQARTEFKRPLVVMTPKSLLRLPEAAASSDALTSGEFLQVIEEDFGRSGNARHVVMLCGKIYYEVAAALRKLDKVAVRLLRLEQLHPFPQFELKKALRDIEVKSVSWVQEEPQNGGAWSYLETYLKEKLELNPSYIGRHASASPATGSGKRHAQEQQAIIDQLCARVTEG